MIVCHEDQQRWLGSEAHVRRQDRTSRWRFRPEWRYPLSLIAAFAMGAAGVGSLCAAARRERSDQGGRLTMDRGEGRRRYSTGAVIAAFAIGGLVGGAAAALAAPQAGCELRRRLARGAQTAQEELHDIASETREALEGLTKDARQTIRRTASRLADAWDSTLASVKKVEDLR